MIQPNTIYISRLNLLSLPSYSQTYPLTAFEEQKLQTFSKQKKNIYRHTRYLIRDILKQHNIDPDRLSYLKSGKPNLPHPYSISLSHSNTTWIMALMQTDKLGIDIQIPDIKNPSAFKKRANLTIPDSELRLYWTQVEAYAKATQLSIFRTLRLDIGTMLQKQSLHLWQMSSPHPISVIASDKINHVIFS